VNHFIARLNKDNRRKLRVAPDAMEVLTHCYWPGNVREIENCIERTATMVQGDVIRGVAFPCRQNRCLTQTLHHADKADAVSPISMPTPLHLPLRAPAREPGREVAREPATAAARSSCSDCASAPASGPPSGFVPDTGWGGVDSPDEVVRIGPTEHIASTPRQFGNEPPEGERERLIWAMEQCAWVQAKAARLLRVTPRQLGYALQKHNIEVHKF
jgi:Nif-specific regulatory protein